MPKVGSDISLADGSKLQIHGGSLGLTFDKIKEGEKTTYLTLVNIDEIEAVIERLQKAKKDILKNLAAQKDADKLWRSR